MFSSLFSVRAIILGEIPVMPLLAVGCGRGSPIPRFVPQPVLPGLPRGVGNALAGAAGSALATLEGKITIAAGAPGQEPGPDFPRKSRPARGDPHGGRLGPGRDTLGGRGLSLGGVCWCVGSLGKLRHELRERGSGGSWGLGGT